ncbi:hypothetical protein PT974_09068 [Cladobotryum mycophilum]|uniref:Uncharacterized protein n=1 Tax=Cladobotryum mycophilum TaxID=491253 RepID=A0ABR0SG89_9HYPO
MPPLKSLMAPRARGNRKFLGPKTPEPFAEVEAQPPSPPRPRFRLRRRNASQRDPPTQQFLASVAAADVPIPSIEEPRLVDQDMLATPEPIFAQFNPVGSDFLDLPHDEFRGRATSPPKTPAPRVVPSLSPKRFPDWSIDQSYSSLESSPECDSSRPSTAQSTQTSASLFSRYSVNSDDCSQFCPDTEDFGGMLCTEDANKTVKTNPMATTSSKRRSRKAQWTKPMSHHLWSTYMTYLQDPHVTPFRVSKAGIPPQGVCMRVAREAKRSWKGSRSQTKIDNKSGSATPTVDASASFMQWPHSCAATRAHLRELCKISAGTAARNQPYLAHSSTPFGRTASRFWNRRSTPVVNPSVFSGSDMALSLAVSTCESMQPQGPLAQLTASKPEPTTEADAPALAGPAISAISTIVSESGIARLGSPFMAARSYGPSSSKSIVDSFGAGAGPRKRSHTVGTRRNLGSPAKFNGSRSSNQKRRIRQPALEPRRSKRPSLSSDFWTAPSTNEDGPSHDTPFPEFSSTSSSQRDTLFVPRTNVHELFEAPHTPTSGDNEGTNIITHEALAPPPVGIPRRLGSPFAAVKSSFSFPNRSSGVSAIDFGIIRRPFATVQQPTDVNTTPTKLSSFRSRLAYIDERLKDFRRRDTPRRRSQSPF